MGSDAENVIGLYRRHAQAWLGQRGGRLMERKWLERFVALLPPGRTVLDVGCGPGEPVARHLIGKGCRVTGIDAAPEMIEIARGRFADARWHVADMRALSIGEAFDGVIAWNSFFHLGQEDQRRMFPVFRRHATPGTVLMFTSGALAGEAIGTWQGEPLYHASLDGSEYRRLLDGNDFDVEDHVVEDPECGGLTVWLARLRASRG